jgi:hypothetical protein
MAGELPATDTYGSNWVIGYPLSDLRMEGVTELPGDEAMEDKAYHRKNQAEEEGPEKTADLKSGD